MRDPGVDGSVAFEFFDFDFARGKKFDFPPFARNGDFHHDRFFTMRAEGVVDFGRF